MTTILRGSAPLQTRASYVRKPIRTFLRRLLAAGALALLWLSAHAASPATSFVTKAGPSLTSGRNSATLSYPDSDLTRLLGKREYTSKAPGLEVQDSVLLTLGGEVITAAARRYVPPAALAPLAVAAAGVTGYQIGSALNDWYTAAGVRKAQSGTGFEYAPPQDSSALGSGAYREANGQGLGYATPEAACQAVASKYGGTLTDVVFIGGANSQYQCRTAEHGGLANVAKVASCPFGQPDASGRCPYTTVWAPITTAEALSKLQTVAAPQPTEVLKDVVDAGLKPEAGPLTVTGPATSSKPRTQTTTGPEGTTTTTSTNNYQYSGDTINYTTTTVTNITNNAGDVVSTSTTTDDQPQDDRTECERNPNVVGCAELDTPEGDIPKTQKDVSFQAESVLGEGQCPANAVMSLGTLAGQSVTIIDWSTFCGYALPIRALVLALASMTAVFIILPGSNQA